MNARTLAHESSPWSVPVPVRPGGFTALRAEHQALDITVDLGRIRPFEVPSPSDEPLLYADLQLNGELNVRRRLGSGRAGFYQGKYLKGVGRTPLAANWCEPQDTYHATGHMFPSSAIRELIATAYMRARGAEDLIVGCEGILVRRMDPQLAAGIARFEGTCRGPFPAADRVLQAISVKAGDFARLSNFIWLASVTRPRAEAVADFAYRLAMYARPPTAELPAANQLSATTVIAAVREAVERGVRNFVRHFELGIYWGSYFNNFTIDGRFLDLEVPLIHGRPFVGKLCDHSTPHLHRPPHQADGTLLGVELLDFIHHVRASVMALRALLSMRRDMASDALARDFLAHLVDELDAQLGPDHLLHSRAQACELITDALVACGGHRSRVRAAVEHEYDGVFGGSDGSGPSLGLQLRGGTLAPPEPTRWSTAFVATALLDSPRGADIVLDDDAELVNRLLVELDAITDPDELLAALRSAQRTIAREIGPMPGADPRPRAAGAEGA